MSIASRNPLLKSKGPLHKIGKIPVQEFLRHTWQKKPLFIPSALPQIEDFFKKYCSPEILAGIACHPSSHCRVVKGDGTSRHPWKVMTGPFRKKDFRSMGSQRSTLLVRHLEKYIAEFLLLKTKFRFLPDWRIEDLMVSFATDQGSVGPHVDQYDVFLFQVAGYRRWKIESHPQKSPRIHKHLPLKILKKFSPDQEFLLKPGDLLYLPPNLAHHGVAEGQCMTLSVGFRAPAISEVLHMLGRTSRCSDQIRYRDPFYLPGEHPAEITPLALKSLKRQIKIQAPKIDLAKDTLLLSFGRLVTRIDEEWDFSPESLTLNQFMGILKRAKHLSQRVGVRMAFAENLDRRHCVLFVNGKEVVVDKKYLSAIKILGREPVVNLKRLKSYIKNSDFIHLLYRLYHWKILEANF